MSNEEGKWYRASLRLMGDNLPIDEIEIRLEISAKSIGKKGLPLNTYKSPILNTPLETNVWCSEYLTKKNVPLEEQIELLLAKLEPKKVELLAILSFPNVEGEFFLGFGSDNGQGGAYFTPDLLRRVADLGLAFSFDLYPPSEFEK